jgi:MYXO-CTERM domain-containing protein
MRVDAGGAGTKGTGGAAGSAIAADGSADEPSGSAANPTADSGCSCRVSTTRGALSAAPLFGLALLAFARRRRTLSSPS